MPAKKTMTAARDRRISKALGLFVVTIVKDDSLFISSSNKAFAQRCETSPRQITATKKPAQNSLLPVSPFAP
jgi:hypothetical protein